MSEEWPFVRGNLRNTGSVSTDVPVSDPTLLWQHDTERRIFGTPLVVGERVYVTTGAQTHHDIDCAVAIDRKTGERLWMSASDAMEVRGTPAVVDGKLYFGDLDGRMFVLDTDDGEVTVEDQIGPTPLDGVCPLVENGTIFTNLYQLDARNADSLELRWKSDDDCMIDGATIAIAGESLFAGVIRRTGEKIYVGQNDSDLPSHVAESEPLLRAIDTATGIVQWETAIDGLPRGAAVVDGTVFVSTSGSNPQGNRYTTIKPCSDEQPVPDEKPTDYSEFGTVHAVDADTGHEQWSTRFTEPARSMPAVDGEYVCFGTQGGSLVALDAHTGELEWQHPINEDSSVLSSPTIANDVVYVGSDDDHLLALDLESGEELWRFETEAAIDANPSVVDGVVYVADNYGNVYALE